MIHRRFATILATAGLVSALTLAAMPAAAQDKTIRMWTFLNPTGSAPREQALAQIIADYEKANPGTKISVETQVFDQMTPKFLAAHNAGNAPDIIWAITDFLGEAMRSGSLADLNELFVKDWSPEQLADRAGPYWDQCNVDGKQYCIFTSRNYIAIAYRADLFAEAGIDPKSLTTWDAFLEAAEKLTVKDASGNVTRYGFAHGFSENQADPPMMVPMVVAKDGSIFDDNGKASFATPAGVEALTFQTDLITEHGVMPKQAATWTVDDVYEQFSSDRLAMIMSASVRVSTLQAKLGKEKVGFMLWPGTGDKLHSPAVMAGWAVGVWSGGENKEAAGRFVEYMLGPDADPIWVKVGGQSPGLASTLGTIGDFVGQPGNGYLAVAAEGSKSYGWLPPVDHPIGGYRQILNKAAQNVVVNGMEPKAALEEAEAEFDRRNAR